LEREPGKNLSFRWREGLHAGEMRIIRAVLAENVARLPDTEAQETHPPGNPPVLIAD